MKSVITKARVWMLSPVLLCLALLTASTLVLPYPDLTYTTTTRFELAGPLGKAVNVLSRLGGGSNEMTQTVYLRGNMHRTDAGETSTIIDLDGERYITLDNKRKTYSVVTFDQLVQYMEEGVQDAKEEVEQASAEIDASAPEQAESDVEVTFDLNVDRTGKQQTIQGFATEQAFLTVSAKFTDTAPDSPDQPTEGTMVIATELWLADQIPALDEEAAFFQRYAERMGQSMLQSGKSVYEGLQGVMAQQPGMQEGMEKLAEEAAKMEGHEVKSTTRVVLVPQGVPFSAEMIFSEPEKPAEKKSKGLRGLARGVLKQAVGADDANEAQDDTPDKPVTIMTMTTELSTYETSPVPPSIFEIPSDYTQVESPFGGQ